MSLVNGDIITPMWVDYSHLLRKDCQFSLGPSGLVNPGWALRLWWNEVVFEFVWALFFRALGNRILTFRPPLLSQVWSCECRQLQLMSVVFKLSSPFRKSGVFLEILPIPAWVTQFLKSIDISCWGLDPRVIIQCRASPEPLPGGNKIYVVVWEFLFRGLESIVIL